VITVDQDPQYVTVQIAAETLGVSRRRIWDLIRQGSIEAIQNPLDKREKLIPQSEIDRLLQFARASKKAAA
jgi:excisionase family DNA binding protein